MNVMSLLASTLSRTPKVAEPGKPGDVGKPSPLPEPSPTVPRPPANPYLSAETARHDVDALFTPLPLPIADNLIPDGESRWTSKPDSIFSGFMDEWPWQISKTDEGLRMYCPGRDERTGANQDKQILLQNNPDGSATLKIQFDGQWLPEVRGKVVQTRTGMVFEGENGERISLDKTREGFSLSFDGLDDYPGKMSELDDMTIDFKPAE